MGKRRGRLRGKLNGDRVAFFEMKMELIVVIFIVRQKGKRKMFEGVEHNSASGKDQASTFIRLLF